jgi:hypothetical protein
MLYALTSGWDDTSSAAKSLGAAVLLSRVPIAGAREVGAGDRRWKEQKGN